MCPERIVAVVDHRQDAPYPVDLRVVLVDFCGNENNGCNEEDGECKTSYQRIGCEVDMFKAVEVVDVCEDLVRQLIELRNVRRNGLREVGALWERLEHGYRRLESR